MDIVAFFTNIMENHSYIAYLVLFIWSFAEGETGLVLAGTLAFAGHMLLVPSVIVASLGGSLSDFLFFYLGKKNKKFVERKIKNQEVIVAEVKKLLDKHAIWVIFIQRYL